MSIIKTCSACNGSGKILDSSFINIMTFGLLYFFRDEKCTLCKGTGLFVTTDLKGFYEASWIKRER